MAQGMYCANPNCQWNKEKKCGKFMYSSEDKQWYCVDCFRVPSSARNCNSQFHFTTTHFNGKPIEVKGIRHLQSLEKEFGVSSHALNFDEKNWSTPPPIKEREMPRELRELISYGDNGR